MDNLQQVRLKAFGDPDTDEWLSDEVINFLLSEHNNSIKETAIECLETVINGIALNPTRERSGGYEAYGQNLRFLEKRLESLKRKSKVPLVPMVIGTSRSNWNDIDKIFGDY